MKIYKYRRKEHIYMTFFWLLYGIVFIFFISKSPMISWIFGACLILLIGLRVKSSYNPVQFKIVENQLFINDEELIVNSIKVDPKKIHLTFKRKDKKSFPSMSLYKRNFIGSEWAEVVSDFENIIKS